MLLKDFCAMWLHNDFAFIAEFCTKQAVEVRFL